MKSYLIKLNNVILYLFNKKQLKINNILKIIFFIIINL